MPFRIKTATEITKGRFRAKLVRVTNERTLCAGEVFFSNTLGCQLMLHTTQVTRVRVTVTVTDRNPQSTRRVCISVYNE